MIKRPSAILPSEWAEMDAKTREYMANRRDAGADKQVTLGPRDAPSTIWVRAGWCPSDECGHTYMWECDEADCRTGPCHNTCK